jgi:hypothetical protein
MKTMMSLLAVALASALPLAALGAEPANTPKAVTPAEQDAAKPAADPMFEQLDQDKDGQISQGEAKRSADVQARFKQLDTDHSGMISLAEWNAGEKQHRKM